MHSPRLVSAHRAYLRGRVAAHRLRRLGRHVDTGWRGVRILIYHRVADASGDPLAIGPERFRRHLEELRRSNLPVVPLREVYDVLGRGGDGRCVAVTLDDGYLDTLTTAAPILREFEIPATVFLPTGIIGGRARCSWYPEPPPFMSWDDVRELVADGFVDVQPHGVQHLVLPRLTDERAREEILGAVEELERNAGVVAHTYCYAAGLYGPREQAIVEASTLLGAVSGDPGVSGPGVARSALRRTSVFGFETAGEFRAVLGGAFDHPSAIRRLRAAVS